MIAAPDPKLLINRCLGEALVRDRSYPAPLPAELADWYCYLTDAGHCIAVAVDSLYQPGADPAAFLVPAPVRAVLRAGWTLRDGYVTCPLTYHPELGLVTEAEDDEF